MLVHKIIDRLLLLLSLKRENNFYRFNIGPGIFVSLSFGEKERKLFKKCVFEKTAELDFCSSVSIFGQKFENRNRKRFRRCQMAPTKIEEKEKKSGSS